MASSIVLIPPFVVLATAFITRKLNTALILGILSAALVASSCNPMTALPLAAIRVFNQLTDPDYLYLYGFLILIGMLIFIITQTGGATGFARTITKHLRSKKSVETSSLFLSSMLFIDDYLSNLTVGYVLRPLTDSFNIPRAKLAYLVHSMSGPLVILIPVTSWVAMITGQLRLAGIAVSGAQSKIIADPFFIYLNAIPYIFYSILVIISVIFVVRTRVSFGPMAHHEHCARTSGNLFGGKEPLEQPVDHTALSGSAYDLLVPLAILLTSVFLTLLYMGGFSWLGGSLSLLGALQNNSNTFCALFISAALTCVCSFVYAYFRGKLSLDDSRIIMRNGFALMKGAVYMVILASTLGVMFKKDLLVGSYLASLVASSFPLQLLPVCIFLVSTIIATVTGSSWGTIAIMTPVVIQMLMSLAGIINAITPDQLPMLFPLLGAVFSGAVCGDHLSPISETTIMACTSSGSYPLDHTITQLYYTLPAVISTCLAFIFVGTIGQSGSLLSIIGALGLSIPLCLFILWIQSYIHRTHKE